MQRSALSLCTLLLSLACHATADRSAPAGPRQPGSALAAAVRVLETVRAIQVEGAVTEVRALASEARAERGAELVRVALDVTVFAPTNAAAVDAFRTLRSALEAEAQAEARLQSTSSERVNAALQQLGMSPDVAPGVPSTFVSYSDQIRLKVRPGVPARLEGEDAEDAEAEEHEALEDYVRARAARAEAIGGVSFRPRGMRPEGWMRFELLPALAFQRFTLGQIATFLASLEKDDPALLLTRCVLERSQDEPDLTNPRGWTFEAELSVPLARGDLAAEHAAPVPVEEVHKEAEREPDH